MEMSFKEAILVQSAMYDMLYSMEDDVELDHDSNDTKERIANIEAMISKLGKFIFANFPIVR
jgi:hypothetical protein